MTSGTRDHPADDHHVPDEQLEAAVRARAEAQLLDEKLEAARQRVQVSAAEAAAAAEQLTEEERDVSRLESLSWSRILSTLKSSRTSDLERESAERDAARYAAGVADARAQADQREVESLRAQRQALGNVEAAYAAALDAKETWLSSHDRATGEQLAAIATESGHLAAEDSEAREALEAGVTAHQHLADAANLLGSARSWSTWDTFGGGELFTDAMKYDKLDQVGRTLQQADAALRLFSTELADVHLPAVEALDIDRLTSTFDVWFDNIFTDWAVRDRIIDAQGKVEQAVGKVKATLDTISARRTEIAARLGVLAEERERLLGGAVSPVNR